jgi:hypothetical protein
LLSAEPSGTVDVACQTTLGADDNGRARNRAAVRCGVTEIGITAGVTRAVATSPAAADLKGHREFAVRTDTNVNWIRGAMEYQVHRIDEHEKRLGRLEKWQHWIIGAAAAIGAVLGIGAGNGLKW